MTEFRLTILRLLAIVGVFGKVHLQANQHGCTHPLSRSTGVSSCPLAMVRAFWALPVQPGVFNPGKEGTFYIAGLRSPARRIWGHLPPIRVGFEELVNTVSRMFRSWIKPSTVLSESSVSSWVLGFVDLCLYLCGFLHQSLQQIDIMSRMTPSVLIFSLLRCAHYGTPQWSRLDRTRASERRQE